METAPPNEPLQTLRVNINIHPHHSIGDHLGRTPTGASPGACPLLSDPSRSERGQHADGHVPGSPHSRGSSPGSGNGNAETSISAGGGDRLEEAPPQPRDGPSSPSQPTHFRPWLAPSKPPSGGHQPHYRPHHPYCRISTTNRVVEQHK